jgi:hypothetical protein
MMKSLVFGVLVGTAMAAHADAKPTDLPAELKAIAAKYPPPKDQRWQPAAGPGCTAPTAAERAAAMKRAFAWIDQQHPEEFYSSDAEMNIGCKDAAGVLVLDVSQDRDLKNKKDGFTERRRNYVLKLSAAAIDVIAEDTSTSTQAWSEWADEGRISLLAQLDVDGDGALDIVYSDHEHEGGSRTTADRVHVRFATGKTGEAGSVTNLVDLKVVNKQLVIAGESREGARVYACLGADLHFSPCAASKALQAEADKRTIINRFSRAAPNDLPDREQLAMDLGALGTRAQRRAQLVAAARETDPGTHVQRKAIAFLVNAGLLEPAPMPEIFNQTHPEARMYLDALAAKLGDTRCATSPLSAEDAAKANAWIEKQDEKASEIKIVPAPCGPYTWVSWWPPNNPDNKRREALLGRDGTRIIGMTYEPQNDPQVRDDEGFWLTQQWFSHDGTIVGIVIGSDNLNRHAPSLFVISNGKAVVSTKGDLDLYRADDRFDEPSFDVFVDGGTLWHATPMGRERLDMALVKDHEARRAAIALLVAGPAGNAAKYAAALELLGANKALVAEAKKL